MKKRKLSSKFNTEINLRSSEVLNRYRHKYIDTKANNLYFRLSDMTRFIASVRANAYQEEDL